MQCGAGPAFMGRRHLDGSPAARMWSCSGGRQRDRHGCATLARIFEPSSRTNDIAMAGGSASPRPMDHSAHSQAYITWTAIRGQVTKLPDYISGGESGGEWVLRRQLSIVRWAPRNAKPFSRCLRTSPASESLAREASRELGSPCSKSKDVSDGPPHRPSSMPGPSTLLHHRLGDSPNISGGPRAGQGPSSASRPAIRCSRAYRATRINFLIHEGILDPGAPRSCKSLTLEQAWPSNVREVLDPPGRPGGDRAPGSQKATSPSPAAPASRIRAGGGAP